MKAGRRDSRTDPMLIEIWDPNSRPSLTQSDPGLRYNLVQQVQAPRTPASTGAESPPAHGHMAHSSHGPRHPTEASIPSVYSSDVRGLALQSCHGELYLVIPEQKVRLPLGALSRSPLLQQLAATPSAQALQLPAGIEALTWLSFVQWEKEHEVVASLAAIMEVALFLQDKVTIRQVADELAMRVCHGHDDDVNSAIHQAIAMLPLPMQMEVLQTTQRPLPLLLTLLPYDLHAVAVYACSHAGRSLRISGTALLPDATMRVFAAALLEHREMLAPLRSLELEGALNAVPAFLPVLSLLTSLTALTLTRCGLRAAHAAILFPRLHVLDALRELDVSDNRLDSDGAAALAAALPRQRALRALRAARNELPTRPADALLRAVARLSRLQALDISGNAIDLAAPCITDPLLRLTRLTSLEVVHNSGLWSVAGPTATQPLLRRPPPRLMLAFASFSALEALAADMPGATLAFAAQLLHLSRLTALHLVDALSHGSFELVVPNILRLRRLRVLRLDTCLSDQASLAAMHGGLASLCRLSRLELTQHASPLASLDTCNLPACSLAAIALPPTLTDLSLAHHRWGSAALGVLCHRVATLRHLHALSLTDCAIGVDGAVMLHDVLLALTALTALTLAAQGFGAAGIAALVPGITGMTTLRDLSLAGNRMAGGGAVALGPALGQLTGLERLALRKNRLGEEGMVALAPQLGRLTRLSWLELTSNRLEERGAEALAKHLPSLPHLCQLHLQHLSDYSSGAVASEAVEIVRRALATHPFVRVL